MPEPDYPAAHSMDTTWYAVDGDGHVALFDSGEAGAVPEGAHTENHTDREEFARLAPPAPYRLLDWQGDGPEHHVELPPRGRDEGLGKTLMFLGSIDPVMAEVEEHEADYDAASEGVVVLFDDLPTEMAWRVHEVGACLGCFLWPEEELGYRFVADIPRRIGLFCYEHHAHAENWISGRYVRKPTPARPLRVDDLPTELREAIGRVRFDELLFAEAESLHPIPRFPCNTWQSAWLDPDGVTVRPIPGREEDFDPSAWADTPGIRVEVPGQAPPDGPGPA